MRKAELVGKRFGKLLVVDEDLDRLKNKTSVCWVCECSCGNTITKTTGELNSGFGTSCGCINNTHGKSRDKVYYVWWDMKRRCTDEKRICYKNYGGRGVTFQDSWSTFEGFWKDMEEGYYEDLTLERKDVNGDYCKENCIWIPLAEQAKNKRKYTTNTVGVAGCSIQGNSLRARVNNSATNKREIKSFNLIKHTLEDALILAQAWLEGKRAELGYSESHGSEG